MAVSRTGLLLLPDELLYAIINLTRPLDFENVMRTCRHIYSMGEDLIAEHNFCRNWIFNWKDGVRRGDPLEVLEELLKAPTRTQTWILPYIKTFHFPPGPWFKDSSECAALLERIERDAPWLAEQLLQLSYKFPATQAYQEIGNFQRHVARLDAPQPKSTAWTDRQHKPNPAFYAMSTLLLLTNVRQLGLGSMPHLGPQINLPWLIKRQHNQQYFLQLEDLKLHAVTRTTLADVSSWLLLPNIKAMMVNGLESERDLPDSLSQDIYDWSFGIRTSTIEHLVLLKATVKTEALGEILEPLRSLRTFVWEENMIYTFPSDSEDESEDDDTLLLDPSQVVHVAREEWLELPDDSETDGSTDDEDTKEHSPSIPDSINEALLFKPNKIVEYLSRHLAHTLEHLVLVVNRLYRRPLILKQYQIKDFKAFHSLTHLEIDTQILKTKKGKARSLTSILPISIRTLCLTMVYAHFEDIYRLLHKVPSRISKFSSLSKIIIRFAEYGSDGETMTRIEWLKGKLEEAGVYLDMQECDIVDMANRPSVTLDPEDGPRGFNTQFFIQPKTTKLAEMPYGGPMGFEETMARRAAVARNESEVS
jgi:hypothetical protein